MLHRRRKRLEELAAKEAAGESFWTDRFDTAVRTKIFHRIEGLTENWEAYYYPRARMAILIDEGLHYLQDSGFDERRNVLSYLLSGPDDMMPTVIEAFAAAFADERVAMETNRWEARTLFESFVNIVLREHRISYELIDGKRVEFSSKELHVAVVAPTLRLLAGRPDWANVESAYLDALSEISKGNASDAITDAGTALQEALTALGCSGNALGPLIKSARSKGLLGPHDTPMLDAIDKVLNWISADRNQSGDAHAVTGASIDDAWFTVHVVGAVILRLSKSTPRT
jgi:hypothetical protein